MRVPVAHGTRYAIGIDLPFFLSQSTVASWARDHGFTNVSVRDRGGALAYDPRRAPSYSDEWDTLVEATYMGNATSLEAPGAPAWVLVLSKPATPVLPVATSPVEKKKSKRSRPRRPKKA